MPTINLSKIYENKSTEELVEFLKSLPEEVNTSIDLSYNSLGSRSPKELISICTALPSSIIDLEGARICSATLEYKISQRNPFFWTIPNAVDRDDLPMEIFHGIPVLIPPQGTIQWQSPEEVKLPGKKSYQTDIYSLGVVFWSIFARKPPYEKISRDIINSNISNGIVDPIPSDSNPAFAKTINQCRQFVPENRPDSSVVVNNLTFWFNSLEEQKTETFSAEDTLILSSSS